MCTKGQKIENTIDIHHKYAFKTKQKQFNNQRKKWFGKTQTSRGRAFRFSDFEFFYYSLFFLARNFSHYMKIFLQS